MQTGERKLGVNSSGAHTWKGRGEAAALIFRGLETKLTFTPGGKESVGPAQAGLGGGACRDPKDGGGAGQRGTGNPLAKALGCPRASGGRDRAWRAPAQQQARVGPKGCGLPRSRPRVASAPGPGRRAGRPRTSPGPGRGGGGGEHGRAPATPRAAEHPTRRGAREPPEKAACGRQEHDCRPGSLAARPVHPAPGLGLHTDLTGRDMFAVEARPRQGAEDRDPPPRALGAPPPRSGRPAGPLLPRPEVLASPSPRLLVPGPWI